MRAPLYRVKVSLGGISTNSWPSPFSRRYYLSGLLKCGNWEALGQLIKQVLTTRSKGHLQVAQEPVLWTQTFFSLPCNTGLGKLGTSFCYTFSSLEDIELEHVLSLHLSKLITNPRLPLSLLRISVLMWAATSGCSVSLSCFQGLYSLNFF